MTHAKVGDCAVCRGTDDGGFHGYCDIPAWLDFDGARVILRLCCLQYLLMKQQEDKEKEEEKETPLLLMVEVHSVRFTSLVILPLFWKNPWGTICILEHPSSAAWGALDGTASAHWS